MRFVLLIFFSLNILTEPWLNVSDADYSDEIIHELKNCEYWDENFLSFPLSLGEINFYLDGLKEKNINSPLCKKSIDNINTYLQNKFIQSKEIIFGIQSGSNNQFFQTKDKRYYGADNVYFSLSNINSNFAYKFKIINTKDDKNYFDESYISYIHENHIFTAGRINRWWSPSNSYSLILSNSARPALGIEYKNYIPIIPKKKIFEFLGYINYEFFLNKLEKEREIPNTLLFGNRVAFKPHNDLKVSLLRIAQFGGDNRPKDASTILKMLIGKDNTSSNLSFYEQPGNQLAGFDFIYTPRKNRNLKIYGQMIGEDEAGYFPSRKLSLFGLGYISNDSQSTQLNIDYIDTYSGINNYSYNHSLYKSGLRYYGIPIGASIDADSKALKLSINKRHNNFKYEFSYTDIHLNKNNSLLNYWNKESVDFNQFDLSFKYDYKKSHVEIIYTLRDKKFGNFSKNNFFINLYFRI